MEEIGSTSRNVQGSEIEFENRKIDLERESLETVEQEDTHDKTIYCASPTCLFKVASFYRHGEYGCLSPKI